MAKKTDNEQNGTLFHRDTPKMPEGYYSGDKPNPNLRAFVETHLKEKPYDPETDDYDLPAFDKSIDTTKATAIYNMHTYWSKKPHDAIRQYIQHYTEPGDLVLDPFCGSGGTALAALIEGRQAVAIDRSPAAAFITKNYCTPVDAHELKMAFEELKLSAKPALDRLYGTKCDRCGGKAVTAYTVYSERFRCPRCSELIPLFDGIETEIVVTDKKGRPLLDDQTGREKTKVIDACPRCYERGHKEELSTRSERHDAIPVLVSYLCENGCKPVRSERQYNDSNSLRKRYFCEYDAARLQRIADSEVPYWFPRNRMMNAPEGQECWGILYRPQSANPETVADIYSLENLQALSILWHHIGEIEQARAKEALQFVFSAILLNASLMYRYRDNMKGGIAMGTYYLPPKAQNMNVWRSFADKFEEVLRGGASMSLRCTELIVSTASATNMSDVPSASVDYIFTDPPYSWKVQYGELNFIWEAWLGLDTHWHRDEIIVNGVRGKTETDWADMMRSALGECYRVLKPGRWISLCYHDTSEGTWALLQDMMAEIGYLTDSSGSALYIDTGQKAWKQIVADKVNKRDLVINFRKPKPGETSDVLSITGDEDASTFSDKVRGVIRDHLTAHPGSTKDRVYDEVVSRMVRAGQMEAHNFDELLNQVAEEVREPLLDSNREMGRWYLKEAEVDAVDSAESAKEDATARNIRDFISECLRENPGADGVHYSDIFERYVYGVKDKPRRSLADWLLDYFYKTESGTYRLPESEEEERIKTEARASGTSRRIKHYIAHLQQGAPVLDRDRPSDATLVEWVRHCKRSGLYEQGKLLYERGGLNLDNLSEEALVDVEEDYQVCARMLARNGGNPKKGKRGG